VPLARSIRLMIETTEETGGDGMKYYREKTALPEYNIVLDSKYPAVVAEKGSGALTARFADQAVDGKQAAIVAMSGAASANAIPQTATARISGGDLAAVAAGLEKARAGFIAQHEAQGKFSIDIARDGDVVVVKVTGTSAHGSRPEEGVNPVPRLAMFLQASGVPFADNQYVRATRYLTDLYGTGYLGERLEVGYRDDFMGPLTISPTLIRERGKLEVTANVRMPRGSTPDALRARSPSASRAGQQPRTPRWKSSTNRATGWPAIQGRVAGHTAEHLRRHHGPGGQARADRRQHHGQADAQRDQLRASDAGQKYTAHNAREYKEVADLNLDMQMFTEMLVRVGNLKSMQ
jgi:acetylornithine deacetylase/succinyl-diaminopimelate desuccinylase-like protein